MNTLLKILREINFDRDRAVVIGRSGLNLWEGREGSEGKPVFGTDDMDLLCPDIRSARECESILIGFGFTKMGAEFISTTGGSIDVLISDPDLPPGADYGFSNMPILRELWDARERIGGVLVVPAKAAILLGLAENARDLNHGMNPLGYTSF